jgi:hypothetical protein
VIDTGGSPRRRSTLMTSKRSTGQNSEDPSRFSISQRNASRRMRAALAGVTDSAGVPNMIDERVLTSQKMSVEPSRATMSSSPSAQSQLRLRISRPASLS